MALVIEDGTGVAGANSYISLADFRDFAALGGFAIPITDADAESWLWRAARKMEFLKWKGDKTAASQPLEWPRSGIYKDDELLASDAIPRDIYQGQAMLAIELYDASLTAAEKGGGAAITEYSVEVGGAVKESTKFAVTENTGRWRDVAAFAESRAHFSAYVIRAGLFAVRA